MDIGLHLDRVLSSPSRLSFWRSTARAWRSTTQRLTNTCHYRRIFSPREKYGDTLWLVLDPRHRRNTIGSSEITHKLAEWPLYGLLGLMDENWMSALAS